MNFSVPFTSDPEYVAFLTAHRSHLASVYYPLNIGFPWDARVQTRPADPEKAVMCLSRALSPLTDVPSYILVNTRFVPPEIYADQDRLNLFLDAVASLGERTMVKGLVFSDFYLIRALDRTGHPVVRSLEAVPGLNCMLDSPGRVLSALDMLETTRFKPPGRLLADRALNRDPGRLATLVQTARKVLPRIRIELLANEGCILNCPFKPAHDAHIALSNTGLVRETTFEINRQVGCHDFFTNHPERIFQSPFIRPEDLHHYRDLADSIKICGRTLGQRFLIRCIGAYIRGEFQGNLLEILDATHFLSEKFHIDNTALGENFFGNVSSCTKQCKTCNICARLFHNAARKDSTTLRPFKDIQ